MVIQNRRFRGKTRSYARVDNKTGRIVRWVRVKRSLAADKANKAKSRKRFRQGHRGDDGGR